MLALRDQAALHAQQLSAHHPLDRGGGPRPHGRQAAGPARASAAAREIVQHPFGSIKQWMNQGAFLLRGLEKVRAEFSLTALAHNMIRAVNLVGVAKLLEVAGKRNQRPAPQPLPTTQTHIRRVHSHRAGHPASRAPGKGARSGAITPCFSISVRLSINSRMANGYACGFAPASAPGNFVGAELINQAFPK